MAGFIFEETILVSELANPGSHPNNVSQENALGFHIFDITDLGLECIFFYL